ncbi:hypothetical protein [Bradyrhizobium sp. CCBAU 53338]|uniref:hypothetical protein n=1 Tax=Bradyrhizobium sp. CCBAU 53338 TaxID=1325111 RepID=UPI00188ABBF4|nr:hypothetical protein [Bradyrhizobium sp. CCBAU 53338]QOZ54098.1 hypothetical protein XH90_24050 [Bradyrhizobium sp. CCBAU 53338]
MKRTTLLALGLMLIGVWSQDSARGQNSSTAPVSLTPPNASSQHASPRNSKPKREPTVLTNARTSPAREPSPPVIGGFPAMPNPAADYDGFNASTDDSDAPSQVTPPARSRAASGSGLDPQTLVDQEDEALKRKLTICQKCK